MHLIVNGDERTVSGVETLADLLNELDLKPERVAVEVDREVVSGQAYEDYNLEEGAEVEIVTFVGGG